jgi:small nuclear ribonucleoprotein (snRNP)-like protein
LIVVVVLNSLVADSFFVCCFYHMLLKAFDQHLNMILGDVEETVTSTEVDEETEEEITKKQVRRVGMLFVRGDIIVLVSPPLRA